jgi:hypothetical protein
MCTAALMCVPDRGVNSSMCPKELYFISNLCARGQVGLFFFRCDGERVVCPIISNRVGEFRSSRFSLIESSVVSVHLYDNFINQ